MSDKEAQKKALDLADEMKELLEKWLGKEGPECDAAMKRVREIKQEINSFGFWVEWGARMEFQPDPSENQFEVEVIVSRPKPDMTPEEKEKYDAWFKKVNGLE